MDRPDNVAEMSVLSALVANQEVLKAKVRDHRHGKENRRDDADDAEVCGGEQTGQQHRADRADNQVAARGQSEHAGASLCEREQLAGGRQLPRPNTFKKMIHSGTTWALLPI